MDKNYYDGLHKIIMKQFNGDATWTDVVNYRETCGVKTTYDYVQRGTTILCELLRAGYTLQAPTEDGEKKEDIIRDILAGITDEGCDYIAITDRTDAIHYAIDHAGEGDVILLAGKGHEEYEIDQTGKHDYSEKKIVLEYIGETI